MVCTINGVEAEIAVHVFVCESVDPALDCALAKVSLRAIARLRQYRQKVCHPVGALNRVRGCPGVLVQTLLGSRSRISFFASSWIQRSLNLIDKKETKEEGRSHRLCCGD